MRWICPPLFRTRPSQNPAFCQPIPCNFPPLFQILLCFDLLLPAGCANPILDKLESEKSPFSAEISDQYERLEPVSITTLFPQDLIKRDNFEILDDLQPDGLTYHYTINSPFGQFATYGEDMLSIRIKEIQALADHNQPSHVEAFGSGVANTILSPFRLLWNLAAHPQKTLKAIPEGVSRSLDRLREMIHGERGTLEDSTTEEIIGFSTAKREIASQYGVDVYSSNSLLQDKLDELAMAVYAGSLGSRLATIPITGPAVFALLGTSFGDSMNELLRERTPEDLRQLNRELLKKMGVNQSLIEEFLSHPWYSPRHETILVHALATMEDVDHRGTLIQIALQATREEEALYFQRLAEMMAGYHQSVVPLNELLFISEHLLLAFTIDRALVAFYPSTRVLWTPEMARDADSFLTAWTAAPHVVNRIECWALGLLSQRTRSELESRGVMVHDHMLHRLLASVPSDKTDFTTFYLSPAR